MPAISGKFGEATDVRKHRSSGIHLTHIAGFPCPNKKRD